MNQRRNLENQISLLQKKLNLVRAYESFSKQLLESKKIPFLQLEDPVIEQQLIAELVSFVQAKMVEELNPPQSANTSGMVITVPASNPEETLGSTNVQPPSQVQLSNDFTKDPLKFITKYKHWCNRQVKFKDGVGNEVVGTVRGLTFPTLQIEANGTTIGVSPNDAQLIMEKK